MTKEDWQIRDPRSSRTPHKSLAEHAAERGGTAELMRLLGLTPNEFEQAKQKPYFSWVANIALRHGLSWTQLEQFEIGDMTPNEFEAFLHNKLNYDELQD